MKILDVEIKTHNSREKQLVNVINNKIEMCREWVQNNTYGDHTQSIVKRNLLESDNLFLALYYMELVPYTTIKPYLEKEFNIDLY